MVLLLRACSSQSRWNLGVVQGLQVHPQFLTEKYAKHFLLKELVSYFLPHPQFFRPSTGTGPLSNPRPSFCGNGLVDVIWQPGRSWTGRTREGPWGPGSRAPQIVTELEAKLFHQMVYYYNLRIFRPSVGPKIYICRS